MAATTSTQIWEQIGEGFVHHYYQQFDADRNKLGDLYTEEACLTWEGVCYPGRKAIIEKLASLPFKVIQHSITAKDYQPTPDSCVFIMVMGQLKADEDQVMGFQQVFMLRNFEGKWACTNDMFRLALHNFGV